MKLFSLAASSACFFALVSAVPSGCPAGRGVPDGNDCCRCLEGYADDAHGNACAACARGYVLDAQSGRCGNGHPGAPCTASLPFPYVGCSDAGGALGACSTDASGASVFPCVCTGSGGAPVACAAKQAERAGGCAADPVSGARMYTTFPNEPVVGAPFSLTVLRCGSVPAPLVVLPFYQADRVAETRCADLAATPTAGLPSECRFDRGDAVALGAASNATTCHGGFVLPAPVAADVPSAAAAGGQLRTFTYANVLMADETAFRTTEAKDAMFRVCARGALNWADVDGHNMHVSRRDRAFTVWKSAAVKSAVSAGAWDDGCCGGLLLGSWCVPLWFVVLLWLLVCCLLGCVALMRFRYRKVQLDMDEEVVRNNEKIETFSVDEEEVNAKDSGSKEYASPVIEDDDDI